MHLAEMFPVQWKMPQDGENLAPATQQKQQQWTEVRSILHTGVRWSVPYLGAVV